MASAWCDADVRHRAAWQQVERICGAFSHLPTPDRAGARRTLDAASERQLTRRRAAKMLLLLCGTGTLGWTLARQAPWAEWNASHKTATGERRTIALADGGSIWLNTASAVDVDYDAQQRRIRLHRGEILIQTAHDTHRLPRPLVVDTVHGRMHALGTRFSVLRQEAGTQVAVFEGAVELQPQAAGTPALILQAGEQSLRSSHGASAPSPADSTRQAWSQGLLLAENTRLGDFIAELARHRPGYLGCAPDAAELISGSFASMSWRASASQGRCSATDIPTAGFCEVTCPISFTTSGILSFPSATSPKSCSPRPGRANSTERKFWGSSTSRSR